MPKRIWMSLLLLSSLISLQACSSDDPAQPSNTPAWFEGLTWTALADFGAGSFPGASLEWADGAIYATRGFGDPEDLERSFWRYDPGADAWTRLADCIFDPYWGSCLTWTGGDKIYATMGNGTSAFYEYSISLDDWSRLADVPESGVRRGGRVHDWPGGGDFLYLIKPIAEVGDMNAPFFRYSIPGDEWTELSSMPGDLWDGNSFCWDGDEGFYCTNKDFQFWHYDIPSDNWSRQDNFPGAIALGGNSCNDGQGFIWTLEGDESDLIRLFDMQAREWTLGPMAPESAIWGATLIGDGESVYGLFGDGSTGFWRLGP